MSGITFILGGVKSGKSAYALEQANRYDGKKVFIATAEARDEDMIERIARHKGERGPLWETIEEPLNIKDALSNLPDPNRVVIIDCLTLWVSNLLEVGKESEKAFDDFISALLSCPVFTIYIVSNEVGMGVVPEHRLGRIYRDQLGLLNRKLARIASKVILMVAGIPLEIKK